jgi:signal transduction histidine kinase
MTAVPVRAVVLAAVACGAGIVALVLGSGRDEPKAIWAVFGPLVVWSFAGTGLYAMRRRPESRVGALMIALGFAWCLAGLTFANAPAVFTVGVVAGGLWGGVFLHLVMGFPSGRLTPGADRLIVLAGYLLFTVGSIPALLFGSPEELGCDGCPVNVLLIRDDPDLTAAVLAGQAALYIALFLVVLVRLTRRWRRAATLERLQLTPVYVCGMLTFLLATAGNAGGGDVAAWASFAAMALLPIAFLGGLLRSHVAHLDAELRERLEELRASRARLVAAGDAERRRLERDLHDGAQSRLVGLAVLLGHLRRRLDADPEAVALLEQAQAELSTGLAELRELARGIHPAVLTERGLEPALRSLAARSPVPVTLEADAGERLPAPVEAAAYFVVSEALANVAKYAQASGATVRVHRDDGVAVVEVADDGVGGADVTRGSGLRGLADRVAALDGALAVDSPPGGGTRLHAEFPCTARVSSPT